MLLGGSLAAEERDSVTVYYFLGEDCKICQYYTPTLNGLYSEYNSDSISFVGLFPNHFSTEEGIATFQSKYEIPFTLKREYFQTKTQAYKVRITPTVVVYNETKEEILYKGRIDDSYYKLGRRRRVVKSKELEQVLQSIMTGQEITTESVEPIGCVITYK